MSSYIEIHTASAFSFLQGASLPEAIVDRAADLGYPALALLDRDGVYGAPRFHKAALAAGIKPIIGAELTMTRTSSLKAQSQEEVRKPQLETTSLPAFPAVRCFPSSARTRRAIGISAASSPA